jgi:hypothetical protein
MNDGCRLPPGAHASERNGRVYFRHPSPSRMRAPPRAEVRFRSPRSYAMPRQSLLTFKKAALVCTIAHGAAATLLPAGGATLRTAAWSQPTFTAPSFALCKLHRIACCPVCHKQEYVAQRVAKAVLSGLKRLGLSKTQSVLEYLGVKTWHEVPRAPPATARCCCARCCCAGC